MRSWATSRRILLALSACACCCAAEPEPPVGPFLDLDKYVQVIGADEPAMALNMPSVGGAFQILPDGLVYSSYLAGVKESRLSTQLAYARHDGWLYNNTLGARIGIVRWGSVGPHLPTGFQVDVEASAQVRLDIPEDVEVRSTDYRGGVPLTYGVGPHRFKLAYYHLSSHVGDEFLIRNPTFVRLNYVRDVIVFGYAHYVSNQLRLYAEAGWAFYSEVSEPWEFQFGIDYAPDMPTGIRGAPFFAVNGHLREEVNFGGGVTAQAGWAWRGSDNSGLLRIGGIYFNGDSSQFSFFDEHEELLGVGAWYDF